MRNGNLFTFLILVILILEDNILPMRNGNYLAFVSSLASVSITSYL